MTNLNNKVVYTRTVAENCTIADKLPGSVYDFWKLSKR